MPRPFTVGLLPVLLSLLFSCSPTPASSPENDERPELGPNAAIIRNPIDLGTGEVDTSDLARLTFAEVTHVFGEVEAGTLVEHDFTFTNTGNVPLLITDARSTCGCTVPDYPEAPVPPGEKGAVSVVFDTKNKYGRQRKPVTITANTYPALTTIYVDGTVINDNR